MPTYLAIPVTVAVVVLLIAAAWRVLTPADPAPPLRRAATAPALHDEGQKSMYERLGPGSIRVAVDQFYHRVLGDAMLAPYFNGLSAEGLSRLHRHQALLIAQVLGGPKRFELHELAIAHRRLQITRDAYWRTVGHLAAVLAALEVDKDIVMHLLDTLIDVQHLVITDHPVSTGRAA